MPLLLPPVITTMPDAQQWQMGPFPHNFKTEFELALEEFWESKFQW